MKLGSKELLRYSKQILLKNIGVAGQKKISNTKVLIIGVGGLGCPLAMYLANMGIGHLGLIDHDKIELSNLNRQILYTSKDLGKYKVIQAKKFLGLINKKIKVNILKKKIDEKNANNLIEKINKVDSVKIKKNQTENKFQVLIGPFEDKQSAINKKDELSENFFINGFVVKK